MIASRCGKIPTTSVRRRISLFSRSCTVGPDLPAHRLGIGGEGQDVLARLVQMLGRLGVLVLQRLRDRTVQGSGVVELCPVSRSWEVEDGEGPGGVAGDVADGLGDVAGAGQA